MAIQTAIAKVGGGKQVAKGTALANPTFGHGVTDGAVMSVNVDQNLDDLTSGSRAGIGVVRTAVKSGGEFTSRAFAASVGFWSWAALGADAVTGSGPYTHVLTPGTGGDLPYCTLFGSQDSNNFTVKDFKVDEIKYAWDGTDPLKVSVNGMGTVVGYGATFVPTTDDTYAAPLRPVGGTFTIDVDGASGTAATSRVMGGEITISNNLSDVMLSSSITPDDNYPGRIDVACSFEVQVDDLLLWRTIVTGTSAGTLASGTPVFGTFSVQFTDGTNTLTIAAQKVAFICDFPSADPAGGYVTLSLEGIAVQPSAGQIVTVTAVNSTPTY